MNYYIQDFCCFCLQISNEKCSTNSSKHPDNLTPFDKIKTVLLELSAVMNNDNRICLTCSKHVDFVYEFNKTCLKNINILNSYKTVLKENKSKIKCDLFVNLEKRKEFKDKTLVSEEVESGSSGSSLTKNYTLCNADFVSKSQSSVVAEKDEIQIKHENCDKLDSEMNKSKQFNENILTFSKIKIEPPESPLNNDDYSNDADYISKNYSSGVAEVKEEIESERSWSNSFINIEIKQTDLKQEWTNEVSDPLSIESLEPTNKDFEDFPVQSTEEVLIKEEENSDLVKDPLEVAEENSVEKLRYSEFQVDEQSNSFQKKSVQADDQFTFMTRAHKCDTCGKLFARKGDLSNHMVIHSRKKFKCDTCGKLFSLKKYYELHMLIHTGEKPYKCDICGKSFNHEGTLNKHTPIHTGEKPHKCDVCGKLFAHKASLTNHMVIHSYKCDVCGKSFNQRVNLRSHMLIHTGENAHSCDTCGKLFARKNNLESHMLIHTNECPHKCEICGKLFTRKEHLESHMLIHTGESPHNCNTCGKSFTRKNNLELHMLKHTGEKPHKCDICGKLFTLRGDLKRHILIHTDEKPHKCDHCGKLFTRKDNLRLHMLIHTGEKPHKCDTCGKLFTFKGDLKRHILIHTAGKSHKYDTCDNV